MRKSRFTESQIVDILKQGEAGVPIAEILRQHNISKATYFHWRARRVASGLSVLFGSLSAGNRERRIAFHGNLPRGLSSLTHLMDHTGITDWNHFQPPGSSQRPFPEGRIGPENNFSALGHIPASPALF